MDRPIYDYASWANAPLDGLWDDGHRNRLTQALFMEEALQPDKRFARYTLAETEQYCEPLGRWLPSACQIYIHSIDEYQAMRRIVGNGAQWGAMCETPWFRPYLELWQPEQDHVQYTFLREQLLLEVEAGDRSAVSAAKTLLDLRKKKGAVGRPKKATPAEVARDDAFSADIERVTRLGPK